MNEATIALTAILRAIDEDFSFDLLLVWADLLEEGGEGKKGEALRWAHEQRKVPEHFCGEWFWGDSSGYGSAGLPDHLFPFVKKLSTAKGENVLFITTYFPTCSSAYGALCEAWEGLP